MVTQAVVTTIDLELPARASHVSVATKIVARPSAQTERVFAHAMRNGHARDVAHDRFDGAQGFLSQRSPILYSEYIILSIKNIQKNLQKICHYIG